MLIIRNLKNHYQGIIEKEGLVLILLLYLWNKHD